jgi:hypothetical protein
MSFIPHMPCDRCKELESRLDFLTTDNETLKKRYVALERDHEKLEGRLEAREKDLEAIRDTVEQLSVDRHSPDISQQGSDMAVDNGISALMKLCGVKKDPNKCHDCGNDPPHHQVWCRLVERRET